MTMRVAVLSTRPGQGSTHFAANLAWSASHDHRVLLLDLDSAGGTLADVFEMDTTRALRNVYGSAPLRTADLESQATALRDRDALRIVVGFVGPGPPTGSRLLEQLRPALEGLDDDLVIADLGSPLAHPGLERPHDVAAAIAQAFQRVLVVMRAETDLLPQSIRTLNAAAVPRASLVVCRPRRRRGTGEARALLEERLPQHALAAEWDWDPERVEAARTSGRPWSGPELARSLGLVGAGDIVMVGAPRRRRLSVRQLVRRGG